MGNNLPMVFTFCVPVVDQSFNSTGTDVIAYACDEEGKTISSHYCSNAAFARQDIKNESHMHDYVKHCGGDFDLHWLIAPPANWDKAQ